MPRVAVPRRKTGLVVWGVCRRLGVVVPAAVLLAGQAAHATFPVATRGYVEERPVVARNVDNGDFLVAYLDDESGTPELRARLFTADGIPKGVELAPFGVGSHQAIGRPAVAYSRNSQRYFIAVPEHLSGYDRVLGRPLDADGNSLCCVEFLFDDGNSLYYAGNTGDGEGSLQIAHNYVADEFAVTMQRTYWSSDCLPSATPCNNSVWAQRVDGSGLIGSPVLLADLGVNGFHGHALAYAGIGDPGVPAFSTGRYFFAAGTSGLVMLSGTLVPYPTLWSQGAPTVPLIPLNHGAPEGHYDDLDFAYGHINGEDLLLVVWSDSDNCRPSLASCPDLADQWTGIWGTFVDPFRLRYDETSGPKDNTPFPISRIWSHYGNTHLSTPRVDFDWQSYAFVVAWREIPFEHVQNVESRSHIRGNYVDYVVPDGLYPTGSVPLPHLNQVLSPVTGSCTPDSPCLSEEDPVFPDIAAAGLYAPGPPVIVWQETWVPNPSDQDVRGGFLACPGIFCDGFESGDPAAWSLAVP